MRVILDTNVLVVALISRHSPPDTIYRGWRGGRFELVTSRPQIEELRRISRYPKLKAILPNHRIGMMINHLNRATVLDQTSCPVRQRGIQRSRRQFFIEHDPRQRRGLSRER
ncbi:MAG: PIN domain-containing protein [Novosphingobium sp.]